MFRHYYAAGGTEARQVLLSANVKDVLVSYAYAKRGMPEEFVRRAKAGKINLMADSGAFSNKHAESKTVTFEGYCEFLQSEKGHLKEYVTFDDLDNRQNTIRHYDKMKEKGFNPLFVDHLWFKYSPAIAPRYASGSKMCWGGMVFMPTADGQGEKKRMHAGLSDMIIKRLRDRSKLAYNGPKTRVHLLGTGLRIPFFVEVLDIVDSIDSTAYLQPVKYGRMLYLKFNDAGWPRVARAESGSDAAREILDKMRAMGMNTSDRVSLCRHAVRVMERYFKLLWNRWIKARQAKESLKIGVHKYEELEDIDPDLFMAGEPRILQVATTKRVTADINTGSEKENDPIRFEHIVGQLSSPIVLRSPAVTLVGSAAIHGETKNDVDLLIHGPLDKDTRRVIEFRLGRAFDPETSKRLQFHDESMGGPFTDHAFLYDLALVPRVDRTQRVEMSKDKADDPMLDWPVKPGKRESVIQIHTRGSTAHFDFRMKINSHLIGWTMFAQKEGEVGDIETVKEARALYEGYTAAGGNKAFKPILAPAKLQVTGKLRQPVDWLNVEGEVFGEGEVGATSNEKGVIVSVARQSVEWGLQLPHFHEYFLSTTPGNSAWTGPIYMRLVLGDKPFWACWISKSALPSVLSSNAVKKNYMPPPGHSAMPETLMAVTPDELKYWKVSNEKDARDIRNELVESRFFTESNVAIVDGQFQRIITKKYVHASIHASSKGVEKCIYSMRWEKMKRADGPKCGRPAFKNILWADGRAVMPVCNEHVESGIKFLKEYNKEWAEIVGTRDIAKSDYVKLVKTKEERYVLGIVLEPNDGKEGAPYDPDSQKDIYSKEEVKQAAHRFMAEFRNVGLMHRTLVNGLVRILESFVVPDGTGGFSIEDAYGKKQHIREGAWLLGLRIVDDDLWDRVKRDDLRGLSIGGSARRVQAKS